MSKKLQLTRLHLNYGNLLDRLDLWALNPWRRYSLFLIILLMGFFLGSSLGMINGVLALMDPIGALFSVLLIEAFVRIRRFNIKKKDITIAYKIIDSFRMGFVYGLIMEGFKLF